MKTTNSVMRESEIELLEKTVEDIMVESSCEPDGERLWVKTSYELADLCRPIISHSLAEARREERERIVSIVSKIPDKEWVRLTTENLFDLLTGDNPERKVL